MNRRRVAAAMALFLGLCGIHWFFVRRPGRGLLYILLGFVGLSFYLGVIDAIRWLRMSNEAFDRRYGRGGSRLEGAVARHSRNHRLYSVWSPISDGFDWNDVDRLRREWQVERYGPSYGAHDRYSGSHIHDAIDDLIINPATGLPMMDGIGGFDSSGHPYGTGAGLDDLQHWHRGDDAFSRAGDDIHSSDGNSNFKGWDH